MTVGNTCVPNTKMSQYDFLFAWFGVGGSPGGWEALKLSEFVMRVEALSL